jgi:trk system potassium uptake protein
LSLGTISKNLAGVVFMLLRALLMQAFTIRLTPGRVILFSFLFIIAIGTFLLSLPISQSVPIAFIDSLFIATTATCVSGLSSVPMSNFTPFGQTVIIGLMQVGGLGLMTFSFFFISLFLNLGMTTQLLAGKILDFRSWTKIRNFLIIIISTTFIAELIGAILLYFPLRERFTSGKAAFYAVFHSVSAFCNAGLDLLGDGVVSFQTRPRVLFIFAALTVAGGLGFFVWFELATKLKAFLKKREAFRLLLHAKITLVTTSSLIVIGTIATWLLERHGSLKHLSDYHSFFVSLFNSASIRSAGFQFFYLQDATQAILLLFIVLMYIGANSGSTGGGIKTTTFATFAATMVAIVRNRKDVEFFGRTIPQTIVYSAIAIVFLSTVWIIIATFLLLITDLNFSLIQLIFETVSAFGTCGLSTGITSGLSTYGKLIIIATMIFGRVGSLTIALAFSSERKKQLYRYPEERIAIG